MTAVVFHKGIKMSFQNDVWVDGERLTLWNDVAFQGLFRRMVKQRGGVHVFVSVENAGRFDIAVLIDPAVVGSVFELTCSAFWTGEQFQITYFSWPISIEFGDLDNMTLIASAYRSVKEAVSGLTATTVYAHFPVTQMPLFL